MAVEQILAGIDVERRPGFRMEGAQAELRLDSHAAARPVAAQQVVQQRKALFDFLQAQVAAGSGGERRNSRFPLCNGNVHEARAALFARCPVARLSGGTASRTHTWAGATVLFASRCNAGPRSQTFAGQSLN